MGERHRLAKAALLAVGVLGILWTAWAAWGICREYAGHGWFVLIESSEYSPDGRKAIDSRIGEIKTRIEEIKCVESRSTSRKGP